jgi:homoserine O-succinyltransferase/O-acetyltransferase
MNLQDKDSIRIAILDMYEGVENEGMRCLREIVANWAAKNNLDLTYRVYDVRLQHKVPDFSYDLYISSGGPGSPLKNDEHRWESVFFEWIGQMNEYNRDNNNVVKKPVFFICHSYQLASRYFEVGTVTKRKSTAFGVFPVHMTDHGKAEEIFAGLSDPLYAVDSRDYQLIEPNIKHIHQMGGKILAIEKARPHVPFERAVMAIRFNKYFIGTQFHPEADPDGMSMYLQREDKKESIIKNYGTEKWENMISHLRDPNKILNTYSHILPNFLNLYFKQEKSQTLK